MRKTGIGAEEQFLEMQAEGLQDSSGHSLDLERPAGGIANEQEDTFNSAVQDGVHQEKVCGLFDLPPSS